MASAWRRFTAAYRMELRLLCLHWSYPVLHLLWAALLIYMFMGRDLGSARYALEHDIGHTAIPLVSLIALFVGGSSATRSQRVRFSALEETLPTGFEVVLGRWLAGVTGLMGAMITPLALAGLQGPASSFREALPVFLLEALISVAFSASIAWWLASLLGMRRWLFPLLAGGWLLFLWAPDQYYGGAVYPALRLLDFMDRNDGRYQELWGRTLEGPLPLWFDLFYVGLVLGLLGLIAWRIGSHRLRMRSVPAGLTAGMGFLLALVSGTQYIATIHEWQAVVDADRNRLLEASRTPLSAAAAATAVDQYELTADLTEPASPRFTADLLLRNQGDQPVTSLTLALHQNLRVEQSSLPTKRQGHRLVVNLEQPLAPGATIPLRIEYSGTIQVFDISLNSSPSLVFFTRETGVRLAPAAGWFPQPELRWMQVMDADVYMGSFGVDEMPMAASMAVAAKQAPSVAPFSMQLTVKGPPGWNFISNLPMTGPGTFAGKQATWATLIGSPRLEVESIGNVTMAGARADLPTLRPLVKTHQEMMAQIARFLPESQPEGLLVMLDDGAGIPRWTPPTDRMAMLQFRRLDLQHQLVNLKYFVVEPMLTDLLTMSRGDGSTVEDWHLREGIASFMAAAYQYRGDAAKMLQALDVAQTGADERDPAVDLARSFGELYAQGGESAVVRVLARIQAEPPGADPSPDRLQAWMAEEVGR